MSELFTDITAWYMANINYFTITLLMTIESSFIPFPSEIVVPPAAYKAAKGELDIYLVVLFSTLGALIGALFNYYFALYIGRTAIYSFAKTKFAKMCLIETSSIEKTEAYFIKNGKSSTLIGRLIPGIRQLISVPAGLAKMDLKGFILYTTIGATVWNVVLALLGYFIPQSLVETYYKELSFVMIGLGFAFSLYLVYKGFFNKKTLQGQ